MALDIIAILPQIAGGLVGIVQGVVKQHQETAMLRVKAEYEARRMESELALAKANHQAALEIAKLDRVRAVEEEERQVARASIEGAYGAFQASLDHDTAARGEHVSQWVDNMRAAVRPGLAFGVTIATFLSSWLAVGVDALAVNADLSLLSNINAAMWTGTSYIWGFYFAERPGHGLTQAMASYLPAPRRGGGDGA